MKTYVHKRTCVKMSIVCLDFITAKNWKQPKCPLTGESIDKSQYIYVILYYYSEITTTTKNTIRGISLLKPQK